MMKYKLTNILHKYFAIEIFECPIDIIMQAAALASNNVTVENYSHYRNSDAVTILISTNNLTIKPRIKRYLIDFQLSKSDFMAMEKIWDTQGCYAVFHDSNEITFKMTDLEEFSRYKALDNFNWTLEIAIPDGASDGWGQIVSPDKRIIDKLEKHIQRMIVK